MANIENSSSEKYAFQSDINSLLSLIINTFYSNKEVFLRELISNASDALDKIRFLSLTDSSILKDDSALEIKIIPDKTNKTLTVWDTGIGFKKEDLVKNLGTIAHSGTREWVAKLSESSNPVSELNLIGNFGCGFYSSYLVAQNVKVVTKHNDDVQYTWESTASGSFTITPSDDADLTRGTKIILYLRDDQFEYLQEDRLKEVIIKHSQFISYPIKLFIEREEEVEVTNMPEKEPEKQPEKVTEDEEVTIEDVKDSDDEDAEKKETCKETHKVTEFKHINTQQPIWMKKPDEVTREEYDTFYKSISNDWESHLAYRHFSVDGSVQFKALLYVPKRAPFNMFQETEKKRNNVKLYVKKVLIMDESNDLLPEYLNFVKGIVDSDDLPLNVSREMLQQNSIMRVIKKNLVKRSIDIITELANGTTDEEKESWNTFYNNFNKNIKLGVHEDTKNREKLLELLRYYSSKSGENMTSLKEYVSRMKENQKYIYYITGENVRAINSSPFFEKLRKKGFEVLFLTDPIDEYMIQVVKDYDNKQLMCCTKDNFEVDETEDEKTAKDNIKAVWEPVCKEIKNILGDRILGVKISDRLLDNPCVLVTDQYGWSANMERIMKAQALRNNNEMFGMMASRKTLEINPNNKLVQEVKSKIEQNKNISSIVEILYEISLIDSGFTLDDPSAYARKMYNLLYAGLTGDDDASNTDDAADDVTTHPVTETTENVQTPLEEVD